MTLLLNGTNGVSDVDGSASTPAIRGTDTNTGIFFPAADTIAFAEGGAEVMRLNSSGNLGVGTTSPAQRLDSTISTATEGSGLGVTNSLTDGYGSGISFYSTATDTTKILAGQVGMRGTGTWANTANASSAMVFSTVSAGTNTERMRIDSSGRLLVGRTTALGGISFQNAEETSMYRPTTNASQSIASFWSDVGGTQTVRAYIKVDGGLANYSSNNVNLSDRREKTNFEPSEDYLAKICAIPVQTFNYINEETDGKTLGVVAQDVQAVAPELITESNWGTEEEPKMRLSIYQTDLQYALMKCIQEQQAIITDLKSRIEALEQA